MKYWNVNKLLTSSTTRCCLLTSSRVLKVILEIFNKLIHVAISRNFLKNILKIWWNVKKHKLLTNCNNTLLFVDFFQNNIKLCFNYVVIVVGRRASLLAKALLVDIPSSSTYLICSAFALFEVYLTILCRRREHQS